MRTTLLSVLVGIFGFSALAFVPSERGMVVLSDRPFNMMAAADQELAREVREAILLDPTFSPLVKKVVVRVKKGVVTLEGRARGTSEKLFVEDLAKKYAGENNVVSFIEPSGDEDDSVPLEWLEN